MTTKTLTIGPKLITALPGPNAKRVLAGDEKYISPSYTRSYPLVAKRGRGIVVEDVDGNEFFDFSAGIAVTSTGHCHPEVNQRMGQVMVTVDLIGIGPTELEVRLARKIIEHVPSAEKVLFCNSGSEATYAAVRLARVVSGRRKLVGERANAGAAWRGAVALPNRV